MSVASKNLKMEAAVKTAQTCCPWSLCWEKKFQLKSVSRQGLFGHLGWENSVCGIVA